MMCEGNEPEDIDVRSCHELLQELVDAVNRIAYAIETQLARELEQ